MPRKKKPARPKLDTKKITRTLKDVRRKLRGLEKSSHREPTRDDVNVARDIAASLQELDRGIRESIKRMAMADGKLKPGQVLTVRDRRVFLQLRPGAKKGSKSPDDYDLVYEFIH